MGYYLGQVCQKHYKIGVSAHSLKDVQLHNKIWGVIIWAKLAIILLHQNWPIW